VRDGGQTSSEQDKQTVREKEKKNPGSETIEFQS
jgi:hypothetical protein